jgi:plasmid stabilization system protein ParE
MDGTGTGGFGRDSVLYRQGFPYYVKQFIERIFEAAETQEDFPELGRKVPEAEATENIRELIFQSYRIMYINPNNLVFILAVIQGSRDLASIEQKPWVVG